MKRSQQYPNVVQLPSGFWSFVDETGWIMSAEYESEIAKEQGLMFEDSVELNVEYYDQWMYDTEEAANAAYENYCKYLA